MKKTKLLITGMNLLILFSCSEIKETSIQYKIDSELSRIFEPGMPGATIIVTQNGETLYKNSYGLANVELNINMEPGMCLKIGSVTKQFTAAAIFKLEELGKLSLDNSISKFLPEYSSEYKNVTIKNLLEHTSGIQNYTGYKNGQKVLKEDYTLKELVDFMLSRPLEFKPGEKWTYSNSGYTILALIIERVSGMKYSEFIKKEIFAPAGMNQTYFASDRVINPNLVSGYRVINDTLMNAEYMSMSHTAGSGDIITNVTDMARWKEAFISGKVINEKNIQKSFTPVKLNDGTITNYSIGWFWDNYRDMTNYYHDGGVYGFIAYTSYIKEKDLYIVILRNRSDVNFKMPPNVIGNLIADIILGYDENREKLAIDLGNDQLKKYVGTYQFVESPGKRKIELIEGKLYYRRPPRKGKEWSKTEIRPESVYSFFVDGKKSTITFEFNKKNEVERMNVNQAFGRVVKLKKIK